MTTVAPSPVSAFDADTMTKHTFCDWMAQRSFDIDELAADLHVHRITITNWRTGRHEISYITLLALRYLERDPDEIKARHQRRQAIAVAKIEARALVDKARER